MNANGNSDAYIYTIAMKHMQLWMDTLYEKVVTSLPCLALIASHL